MHQIPFRLGFWFWGLGVLLLKGGKGGRKGKTEKGNGGRRWKGRRGKWKGGKREKVKLCLLPVHTFGYTPPVKYAQIEAESVTDSFAYSPCGCVSCLVAVVVGRRDHDCRVDAKMMKMTVNDVTKALM